MQKYIAYIARTALVCVAFLICNFASCLYLSAPIGGEYWVRELLIVKKSLVKKTPSSRIVFLGGSSTLFGIDAKQVEASLGVPAINLGLHAGMRLDRLLLVGVDTVQRGDVVVLSLEAPYYSCKAETWNNWQVRNALAWDRDYFNSFPMTERLKAIFTGGEPTLGMEIVGTKVLSLLMPHLYTERYSALVPANVVLARFEAGTARTKSFAYSAYNLDNFGDIGGNKGAAYFGPEAHAAQPNGICPAVQLRLANFASRIRAKGAVVVLAHTPYLIDGKPDADWQRAEAGFLQDSAAIGLKVIDSRNELFFLRDLFFNTNLHLNSEGRSMRTKIMIRHLQEDGIGKASRISHPS